MDEATTTMRIYAADRQWLARRQRQLAQDLDRWPSFADILHDMIEQQERGNGD